MVRPCPVTPTVAVNATIAATITDALATSLLILPPNRLSSACSLRKFKPVFHQVLLPGSIAVTFHHAGGNFG